MQWIRKALCGISHRRLQRMRRNRKERLCCLWRDRHCSSIAKMKLIHYPPADARPYHDVADQISLDEAEAALRAAWDVFGPERRRHKIALAQNHRPPDVLYLRTGNVSLQMPEHHAFCAGVGARRSSLKTRTPIMRSSVLPVGQVHLVSPATGRVLRLPGDD
jgi:hypothetical protein